MKLNFLINEDHLLMHVLSSISPERFSSSRHKKDIVRFQNYAWEKDVVSYNFLIGRTFLRDIEKFGLLKISQKIPKYLIELKKSKYFQLILKQTKKYREFCKKQWERNYFVTSKIIKEITGFNLNRDFNVYITHPSLKNGAFRHDNMIEWGHHEEWPNYATIYLWHEILHSYFGKSDKEHAVIEFIADEELRSQLNHIKYPPFIGHEYLKGLKKKIMPFWRKYLSNGRGDIKRFIKKITVS